MSSAVYLVDLTHIFWPIIGDSYPSVHIEPVLYIVIITLHMSLQEEYVFKPVNYTQNRYIVLTTTQDARRYNNKG